MPLIHFMLLVSFYNPSPVGDYIFKVNNRNSRSRCKICSKLTIKTPERRLSLPSENIGKPYGFLMFSGG